MTIYVPDMSGWDAGIDLDGSVAAIIKATEGTGYLSPAYAAQAAEAKHHGAFTEAYHFLHQGSAAQQAAFCHGHVGKVPLAVDAEPTTGLNGEPARRSVLSLNPRSAERLMVSATSAPTITDICAFVDAYRQAGGICWWVYLPHWYWVQLGSPSLKPLTDRGLLLWSSDYGVPYTDADSGRGWQGYGGMEVGAWQYTSTMSYGGIPAVDFTAFRGSYAGMQDSGSVAACLAEFESLTLTGLLPPAQAMTLPPVRDLTVIGVGRSTVKLGWVAPQGPSPYAVGWYQVTIRRAGDDLPTYPRPDIVKGGNPEVHQFGSLPLGDLAPGEKLTAMVRAIDTPARAHASDWATVQFP